MQAELGANRPVFAAFWRFASERQLIYERRVCGIAPPWTCDPVLAAYRFTNVYRAADRVSQDLIRDVLDSGSYEPADEVLRIALFRFFNKPETWQLLRRELGDLRCGSFDPADAERALASARADGATIYSAAYIVPPVPGFGSTKHVGHVRLAVSMAEGALPERLQQAASLREVFVTLRELPGLGDFLAYQLAIDLNYSDWMAHDEDDFVVPGPGAIDGLSKIYPGVHRRQAVELIRRLTDEQEAWFDHFELPFGGLFGRRLHLIDVQNLLCEISKYTRVTHPEVSGVSGRTRIKQAFSAAGALRVPVFPKKWGLRVPTSRPSEYEASDPWAAQGELFSHRAFVVQ